MFAALIDAVIDDFKANPRNKILLKEDVLLSSAIEESGLPVTASNLRSSIRNYIYNEQDGDDVLVYDSAVYACSVAANHCFGDQDQIDEEDYSVSYEINWIENEDGTICAEIRPV